ncbi:MAG: DUF1476 domain-containing protein [Defluviicoccus sp.]|nr:MAG: DUF1476 domain-containing protein [Defluviicoccus sp.]
MTTDLFRDIEQGHEAKFKLDEELRFKVRSRRNKLFGLWAAQQLGFEGEEAREYARSLVLLECERPGHLDVGDKVIQDLRAVGADVAAPSVVKALADAEAEAVREIVADYPMPLDTDHVQVGG